MSGTPFEIYVYNTIRKRYPAYAGWEIYEQEVVPYGSRIDFYVVRRNTRRDVTYGIVIDAKDKESLALDDIDQIVHYSRVCKADERIIYVANDTDIPFSVQEYSEDSSVKIIRTQWRA